MTCLCGHRGFVGPSACVLEKGHEGVHKYGDYQQALAIAAAKELKTLRDQLAAAQAREAELVAHVERLREALEAAVAWACEGMTMTDEELHLAKEALTTTPAQSLTAITDPLNVHIERLREALDKAMRYDWADQDGAVPNEVAMQCIGALAAIPAQSITKLRNEVLEEAAKVCEQNAVYGKKIHGLGIMRTPAMNAFLKMASDLRAMKEP